MNSLRTANALMVLSALVLLSALGAHPCCQAASAPRSSTVDGCHAKAPGERTTVAAGREEPGAPNRATPAFCAVACVNVALVAQPSSFPVLATLPAPAAPPADPMLPLVARPLDHVPLA